MLSEHLEEYQSPSLQKLNKNLQEWKNANYF